jgi:hypothetical protein
MNIDFFQWVVFEKEGGLNRNISKNEWRMYWKEYCATFPSREAFESLRVQFGVKASDLGHFEIDSKYFIS